MAFHRSTFWKKNPDTSPVHKIFHFLESKAPFIKRIYCEMLKDQCFVRATSLAYSSLLALVPLSALIFSLFTAFGAFETVKESIQEVLVNQLIPTKQDEIMGYVNVFIDGSKALGVVGLLLFAVTSVLLLNSINVNFNAIWGSTYRKSFLGKFTTYTAVIFFGTLFIGASFTITAAAKSLLLTFPELGILIRWSVRIFPSLLIFLTFWLMITSIPSGKVRIKSSLIGALAGTVLWEIARGTFVDSANYVIRMSVVYGSLAAIPIFLFWLYLVWIIILIALEITYIHQFPEPWRADGKNQDIAPVKQIEIGLKIFLVTCSRFIHGEEPPTLNMLSREFAVPSNIIAEYIRLLARNHLVFATEEANPTLLPGRDPADIMVHEVIQKLYTKGENRPAEDTPADEISQIFLKSGLSGLETLSVKSALTKG